MVRVACFPREEDVKGESDSCQHLAYRQNHHPYPNVLSDTRHYQNQQT